LQCLRKQIEAHDNQEDDITHLCGDRRSDAYVDNQHTLELQAPLMLSSESRAPSADKGVPGSTPPAANSVSKHVPSSTERDDMADKANSSARAASLSEATGLNERLFRRTLVSIAVAGLLLGLLAWGLGRTDLANWCWAGGTVPVVIGLLISMIRDLLAGRLGVDAVAFVSMSGALALGQNLAVDCDRSHVRRRQYPGGFCRRSSRA
jgi:hypothetical protein